MQRILSALLIAVCAFLLFWRLDGAPLWRDEGTTANWGRLMAESGSWVPWVYDFEKEQLIVQAADGHDFNSRLLPAMQSYLQFYVAAVSFRLFGVSEWTARLPFALIGAAALWALYQLGVTLFGGGLLTLVPPALAGMSIVFLNASRQCRYYALVVLIASLLLNELCKYLKDPAVAARKGFYVKLGVLGLLLYFSNYVSFVGTWAAIGLFLLWQGERTVIRNFILLCIPMAALIGADFWLLHSEFAGSWPPERPQPLIDVYQGALANRGSDFWRIVPLTLLVPAGIWLYRREAGASRPLLAAMGVAAAAVLAPLALFGSEEASAAHALVFWGGAALCLLVPAAFFAAFRRLPKPGPESRAAVLAALVLILSPAIAIAAGRQQALTRHYYQILPAGVLLCSTAVAAASRRSRGVAAALFAGMAVWPNIDNMHGSEQLIPRQLLGDRSYSGPLLDFFEENVAPGDRVAFLRNVKGMTVYFYRPDIRWVCLLDSAAPHNRQFRGRIPADQFDDWPGADWYVHWDPRGEVARGLNPKEHEEVWEYSYATRQGLWDRGKPRTVRTYKVYKKRATP